jgi:hypothetical protein
MSETDVFFEKHGWVTFGQNGNLRFYINDYAALGFAEAATVDEIESEWPRWQSLLFQLRKRAEVGDRKDLYLVIVMGDEDPNAPIRLQRITDDTNVCRKIVLPQRGRTATAALMELSLFQVVGASDADDEVNAQDVVFPLDDQVITDLAKKGVATIFDKLLAQEYRRIDET